MLAAVAYLCTVVYVVRGDDNLCASDYKYANDINKEINITESCNDNSPCIAKCCPLNQILASDESTKSYSCLDGANVTSLYNFTQLNNYSDVVFYENDVKKYIRETTLKLENFTIIYNEGFLNNNCSTDIEEVLLKPTYKVYIIKSGGAVIRRFTEWYPDIISPGDFCIDHQIGLNADGKISKHELVIRMRLGDEEEEETFDKYTITASAMLVSCVFLLLVLAVYLLLPDLRNLAGLMMMTNVSSLTGAFLTKALQILLTKYGLIPRAMCVWIGLLVHYTLVASFTWMNVTSFDIWWSMRGFRKMRQIHRRGILVKFVWYSLYGWGAPLLLILFMIIVENQDLTHLPNFVKPNYINQRCFMEEQELMLYLYCPMLITICVNITLFLMTAYNIWRIKHGVTQHNAGNSRRNKKDETRFGIYLKLSLVMGLNWILEVLSAFIKKDSMWWYASDIFNALTGLFIFIIFICKRSIIIQLCKRFGIEHDLLRKWRPVDSTNTDSTRLNSRDRSSRRKILHSETDASDVDDQEKKHSVDHGDLKLNNKMAS